MNFNDRVQSIENLLTAQGAEFTKRLLVIDGDSYVALTVLDWDTAGHQILLRDQQR